MSSNNRKVTGVMVVFENCDIVVIDAMSCRVNIQGISNSLHYSGGEILHSNSASAVSVIMSDGSKVSWRFPEDGNKEDPADRLTSKRDIVSVGFLYDSGETELYFVPWSISENYASEEVTDMGENKYEKITSYDGYYTLIQVAGK